MIVKFLKTDMLVAYNGYDFGNNLLAVSLKDCDAGDVSDEYGKYLLKTFPNNFVPATKAELPVNRAQATIDAQKEAAKKTETMIAENEAKRAQGIIIIAEKAFKEFDKKLSNDDKAEVKLLIDDCKKAIKTGDGNQIRAKADEIVIVAAELNNQYPGFNKFAPPENKIQKSGENK